jgi:hypothetical protein
VQREDIGAVEMAEALHLLLSEDQTIGTQRQLAKLIGKSEQWVSDMFSILNLPAKLREKLRTSVVSVSYGSAMSIARCKDDVLQVELVSDALKGESVRAIRRRIAERKTGGEGKREETRSPLPAPTPALILTETYMNCTATVRGPEGKQRDMRTALKRLLKKL